ncbi:hypothetical protein [Streptomyces sp. NPDC006739]|uniref:hypothetical protein n=1 Tax=Streptomyces sp. NPDC006739 TaxID=3364763 RepID=UPI0036B7638D
MAGPTSEVKAGAAGCRTAAPVVAAGGGDGTVRVWDATSGQQIGDYAFPAAVRRLA